MNPLDAILQGLKKLGNYAVNPYGEDNKQAIIKKMADDPMFAERIKSNPELLKSLVGSQLFGSTGLDISKQVQDFSLPEGYARTSAASQIKNNPGIISDATKQFPALSGLSKEEALQVASGKISPELQDKIDEFQSKQAGVESDVKNKYTKAQTAFAESQRKENEAQLKDKETVNAAKEFNKRIIARVGSGNVAKAAVGESLGIITPEEKASGKYNLSADEIKSLYTDPDTKDLIHDQAQGLLENQRNKHQLQGNRAGTEDILAREIVLKGQTLGKTVGLDEAKLLIQNPALARKLENETEADVSGMSTKEQSLFAAAQISKQYYREEGKKLLKQGIDNFSRLMGDTYKRITAGQVDVYQSVIDNMNQQAELAFAGTGIQPPEWKLGSTEVPGMLYGTNKKARPELVSVDSMLGNAFGKASVVKSVDEQDIEKKIRAKYPDASDKEIADAVKRAMASKTKGK